MEQKPEGIPDQDLLPGAGFLPRAFFEVYFQSALLKINSLTNAFGHSFSLIL